MTFSYWISRSILAFIFRVFFRRTVTGAENIPARGGVLVVGNHVSYLDPLVIGSAIPKRQATFMAKQELFRTPPVSTFVRQFSLPVDKDKMQPSTIKSILRILKNGGVVVLFPEGGRSADNSLLEAQRGAGMLAATTNAVIVPAYIDGTHRALPVGAKFIRFSKIKVTFGSPIYINASDRGRDFHEKIGSDIMKAIAALKSSAGSCN